MVDAGTSQAAIAEEGAAVRALAKAEPFTLLTPGAARPDPSSVKTAVMGNVTVMVSLTGLVDGAAEKQRLQAELEDTRNRVGSLGQRLSNEAFRSRAPADVIAKEEAKLAEAKDRLARLEEQLARMESAGPTA